MTGISIRSNQRVDLLLTDHSVSAYLQLVDRSKDGFTDDAGGLIERLSVR